jgi:hypothetical protein
VNHAAAQTAEPMQSEKGDEVSANQLYEIVNRAVRDALAEVPDIRGGYEIEYRSNPFFAEFGLTLNEYVAMRQAEHGQ